MIKVFTFYANTLDNIFVGSFEPMKPGLPGFVDCYTDWFAYSKEFTPSNNLEEVLAQDIKIACVPEYFDRIAPDFDHTPFDLILITVTDHTHYESLVKWIENMNIKRYLIAVGAVEGYDVPDRCFIRPWYVWEIMRNSEVRDCPLQEPVFMFESLLGTRKDHRDFVMSRLFQTKLLDQSIVTYRENFSHGEFVSEKFRNYLHGKHIPYPYVSPNLDPAWEIENDAHSMEFDSCPSPIKTWTIPWDILAHARYSIVTESYSHRTFLMSEKTAKPILARRLFVMFGCYQYLRQLRELYGFQTFGSIIDESYDDIRDDIQRFETAFDQVLWLARQDPAKIQEQAQHILESNRNHLLHLRRRICEQMTDAVMKEVYSLQHGPAHKGY